MDVLRIVAAIMVVMIHTSGMLLRNVEEGSVGYWIGICNGELVRCAVPLFFMISGALLLRPTYIATPKQMVHKAFRVICIMLVWSFIYSIINCNPLSIKSIIFSTITGPFHFWFFEFLIGLYLLTPLLKAIVEYKDGVLVKYYLCLFVIFGICISSLQAIPYCHKWIMDVTTKIHIELMEFSGYFMLGYYLSRQDCKIPIWLLSIVCVLAMTVNGFIVHNTELLYSSDKWWWLVFVECICMYLIIKQIKVSMGGVNSIVAISGLTMGIYIVHPIFLNIIPEEYWTAKFYIFDVIFIIVCSALAGWLIKKIPYIGKWILSV